MAGRVPWRSVPHAWAGASAAAGSGPGAARARPGRLEERGDRRRSPAAAEAGRRLRPGGAAGSEGGPPRAVPAGCSPAASRVRPVLRRTRRAVLARRWWRGSPSESWRMTQRRAGTGLCAGSAAGERAPQFVTPAPPEGLLQDCGLL